MYWFEVYFDWILLVWIYWFGTWFIDLARDLLIWHVIYWFGTWFIDLASDLLTCTWFIDLARDLLIWHVIYWFLHVIYWFWHMIYWFGMLFIDLARDLLIWHVIYFHSLGDLLVELRFSSMTKEVIVKYLYIYNICIFITKYYYFSFSLIYLEFG